MRYRLALVPVLMAAAALLLSSSLSASAESLDSPARPSGLSADQWREDLDFLVKTVAEKHRHPFDNISRSDFEKAAASLRERIPALLDHEIVVGMVRLVAMLRDGHSRLTLPVSPAADTQSHTPTSPPKPRIVFRLLPVKFYLFSDGLYIHAAAPERRDLVGAKVVRIGALTADAAVEAVKPTVAYDSEMWIKQTVPQYLQIPEILHACGAIESLGGVPLTVEKDGKTSTVVVEPLPPGPEPAWVAWSEVSGISLPLYLRHRDKPFWLEYLADRKTLYVQVNGIQDDKGETLAAFAARVAEMASARGADKLVLDLRFNGGGNNYLSRGLVLALLGLDGVNRYGRLFTIIGRNTFSAAVSTVSALERWSETIFVGEPTGNAPSQYGDSRRYPLPHSGLTVRLSSIYWRDADANERRPWVAPDLKADLSWSDFAAGGDPALEAALAYTAPESLLGQLEEKIRWGGIAAAAAHYYKYRNSPRTASVRTEDTLLSLASFLTAEKRPADAAGILRRCVAEYPDSFAGYLTLGRLLVGQGDGKGAVEALKKALELKPGYPEAAEWLKKAEALDSGKK